MIRWPEYIVTLPLDMQCMRSRPVHVKFTLLMHESCVETASFDLQLFHSFVCYVVILLSRPPSQPHVHRAIDQMSTPK